MSVHVVARLPLPTATSDIHEMFLKDIEISQNFPQHAHIRRLAEYQCVIFNINFRWQIRWQMYDHVSANIHC